MMRTTLTRLRIPASRAMYSSGPVDAVKNAASKVNRVAGDAALKGIETGEKAADAIKSTVSSAKGSTNELSGQAKGKAHEVAGEAKGKAHEVKGAVNEAKSKA